MALAPQTLIALADGLTAVEHLGATAVAADDGREFKHVVAAEGPLEPRQRTLLANGLVISSNAAQRFVAATEATAEPSWLAQRALKPGDRLLLAYQRYDWALDPGMLFLGKDYDGWCPTQALIEDKRFWQMLGYALGDGFFPAQRLAEDGFRMFAYKSRAVALLDTFAALCAKHDLDPVRTENPHPQLALHHIPMQRWLRDLGFRSMSEGTRFVPDRVFRLPAWVREAVLRGFFSAWGEWHQHTRTGVLTPHVRVADPNLNQGILLLLWSVGVAATVEQLGWARRGDIFVRDLAAFQHRVGFLLPHQQRAVVRPDRSIRKWDTLHLRSTVNATDQLQAAPRWRVLPAKTRNMLLRHRQNGMGLRRHVVLDAFSVLGLEAPWWLFYHQARIDRSKRFGNSHMYGLRSVDPQSPTYLANFVLAR